MPTGAHWTLRYEPTVDERIQARVHANLLRRDEFVQSVNVLGTRTSCTLEVQFCDDRSGPYDHQLQQLEARQPLPPTSPPEAIPHRTRDEILTEYLRSPVVRTPYRTIPWAPPIRRNIDYTAVGRRTFFVDYLPEAIVDPPYNAQLGSSVHNEIEEISRLITLGLGVGPELLTGVPLATPTWLVVGAWVQHKSGSFAEVSEMEVGASFVVTRVHFKLWRVQATVQSLPLPDFLKDWTSCEKPHEPLSRYKRVLRGF